MSNRNNKNHTITLLAKFKLKSKLVCTKSNIRLFIIITYVCVLNISGLVILIISWRTQVFLRHFSTFLYGIMIFIFFPIIDALPFFAGKGDAIAETTLVVRGGVQG